MTTIITINSTDLITNSRADINSNFAALNAGKIESSWVDTDTALSANSDSRIPTQKAIKAYVDAGGNVNSSTTTRGLVEQATSAEVTARSTTGSTGAPLFINPGDLGSVFKFGGTGADGALSISSGTTTISLGGARFVTKNYTSISITGTGKLAFSNPHANGTFIILKSQGGVTLTSSQAPMIDGSGMGGAGGAGGVSNVSSGSPQPGTAGQTLFGTGPAGGGAGPAFATGTAGVGGAVATLLNSINYLNPTKYGIFLATGAGGAGGGAGNNSGGPTSGGAGGNGGAAMIIECAGAWNFTTAGGISVAGLAGGNGTNGGAQVGGRGGSGGGAGSILILYGSLTANSGTITVTGGAAGSPGSGATGTSTGGSASGAGALTAGTDGLAASTSPVSGVAGGTGFSVVMANTEFC